jgi:hypothetical protein
MSRVAESMGSWELNTFTVIVVTGRAGGDCCLVVITLVMEAEAALVEPIV